MKPKYKMQDTNMAANERDRERMKEVQRERETWTARHGRRWLTGATGLEAGAVYWRWEHWERRSRLESGGRE